MNSVTLTAAPRTVLGKAVAALRRSGKIPGIVYGKAGSQPIVFEVAAFKKTYTVAGESSLVDLVIDGQPRKVLIADVQFDPVTSAPIHADFHEISMTEKLTTDIPVIAEGEAPAVKEQGGILVKNLTAVKVQCLPSDLVHEIRVPLSALKAFGDLIRLRDIAPPPGIAFLIDPDTVVFAVAEPRSEEELKSLEGKVEVDVAAVEVAKKEKKAEEGEAEAAPAAKEKKDKKE